MKTVTGIALSFLTVLAFTACAQRSDDGTDTGPDAGMTDTDAGTDEVPPAESAAWPCRGGKDSGGDYFECAKNRIADKALTKKWVGVCSSESINGYWVGTQQIPAVLTAAGDYYRLYLKGAAADCELTVSQCTDVNNPDCWMQYGLGTITVDADAGPYRWCGTNGSCAMKLKRDAGHTPTALGN